MERPTTEPMHGSPDAEHDQQKMQQFAQEYDRQATEWLIAELKGHFEPGQLVTMDDISRDYPHYNTLLVRNAALSEFAGKYSRELLPYLQAPFPLANGDVIQGPWIGHYKIGYFTRCGISSESIGGKRVLDIGCNAGFDTFYLSTLGPREIIGIEPTP